VRRVALALLLALCSPNVFAQGTAYTGRSAGNGAVENTPIVAIVRAGDQVRTITFVGRNKEGVLFTESDTGEGTRLLLKADEIKDVSFRLDYDPADVFKAVRERDWNQAVRILLPVLKPTLPYLDLVENNAAEPALDLGDYMMRGAEQRRRAGTPESVAEMVTKQYTSAYTVFTQVAQADWSYVGKVAALKRVKCLLELDKPKTGDKVFAEIDEPMIGDAAYGLYWLIKAELGLQKKDFTGAMDAAVKSLCFESKDADTFPDALLVSAMCYEELQNWHRARDVYYEVACIFPGTDWEEAAVRRLKFIRDKGFTQGDEKAPIENVFFGLKEDMNARVNDFLDKKDKARTPVAATNKVEETPVDLKTAK
jgi:hypothetical protein